MGVALTDFVYGNIPLASGVSINGANQLIDAVEYYLQVKAANPNAHITITGHSLGGALAALVGVLFGVEAHTFDQVPAYATATTGPANLLRDALMARKPDRTDLTALDNYIAAMGATSPNPDSYEARAANITNINVHGEVAGLIPAPRIGNSTDIWQQNNLVPILGKIDLHSIALLSTFLQSGDLSTATEPTATPRPHTLGQVSYQLSDLLKMIFDPKLYAFQIDDSQHENFLERLVKHEVGVQPDAETGAAAIPADAMVTRFTSDLWKLAQDGGLTMTDQNPSNADLNELSNALTAFAMQMYYEDTTNATDPGKQLFTDLGTGGIQFDLHDVSKDIAAMMDSLDPNVKTDLAAKDDQGNYLLKGYEYFLNYLSQGEFLLNGESMSSGGGYTIAERALIKSMVSKMRDWYVQAGAGGMTATDTQNRGAFMLGGSGADTLTGGTGADLLVGNAGDDVLNGGQGNDVLLGGVGDDTYKYTSDDSLDTILDSDGQGSIVVDGATLAGGEQFGDARVHRDADGHLYVDVGGDRLIIDGNILIEGQQDGELGLALSGPGAAPADPVTTRDIFGDIAPIDINPEKPGIQAARDAQGNLVGTAQPYEDLLEASAASEHISFGELDDCIAARGGNDWIESGTGADYVHGEDGDDLIEGGSGADILIGGTGNDRIYADTRMTEEQAIAGGNNQSGSGLKGDWLSGEAGDDILIGGADNDVLAGGGGADLIIAGAGDDNILGDADYKPQFILETTPRYTVNDINWYHTDSIMFNWGYTDVGDLRVFAPVEGDSIAADGAGDVIYAGNGNDSVWGGAGNDIIFGEGGDDRLRGGDGNDVMLGGADQDILWGNAGSDYLDGGAGKDEIQGGDGDDILIGGAGDDTLFGDAGRDTYIYNRGDGRDTIVDDKADNNIFRFGAGIGANDITLRLGSLMLDLGNGDEIHIDGFDRNDVFNSASIGGFEFADGSVLSTGELLARGFDLEGTSGDDVIVGTNTTDRISGLAGIDYLNGGEGDDTYYLAAGDSSNAGAEIEVIVDTQGRNAVEFGQGIQPGGIRLATDASGQYLLIDYTAADTVAVEGGLTGSVSEYRFAGGQKLNWYELVGRYLDSQLNGVYYDPGAIVAGGNRDDTITVTGGGAVVSGGRGNDTLIGTGGGNTYLYNLGDGTDTIADTGAADGYAAFNRIVFGTGITPDQIKLNLGSLKIQVGADPDDAIHIEGFNPDDAHGSRVIDSFEFADGTVLSYDQLLALGFDINGTEGSDQLTGTSVDDRLAGHGGDDVLSGGAGNDTYLFNLNDGYDTVYDAEGANDAVRFGAGITLGNITIRRDGQNLWIEPNAGNGRLTLQNFVDRESNRIERFEFADGSVLSAQEMLDLAWVPPVELYGSDDADILVAGDGNDLVVGNYGDDVIYGGKGNDRLYGNDEWNHEPSAGGGGGEWIPMPLGDGGGGGGAVVLTDNDTLHGGAGDDYLDGGFRPDRDQLYGGAGNDTYVFRVGSGNDTVVESGDVANLDIIYVEAPSQELSLTRNDTDLILELSSGDRMTVKDFFVLDEAKIERIVFDEWNQSEQVAWDAQAIAAKAAEANDGANYLIGTDQDDVLDGLGGDDILLGGLGADTYLYRRGSGADTIIESAGDSAVDTLRFEGDIAPTEVAAGRAGSDLVLLAGAAADRIVLKDWYANPDARIEAVAFADGTVWNAADIEARVRADATEGGDFLQGDDAGNTIDALAGSDFVDGGAGDDVLYGGTGDDVLVGGEGNNLLIGGAGVRFGRFVHEAANDSEERMAA